MVSVCLPSDALLQHLSSYLGFSYLGRGVSLHGCSSKVQPFLLTLDKGYLLTAALPDLQHGIAPLGPPAPSQPLLLITVKNTNLEVLGAKASTYEFERRHSLVHNEVPGVAEEGGLWKEGDGWVGGKGGTPPARCRLCPPVPSVQL